jgi:N-acetylglucosaminyldiphosphoundecaprenol N-acetyl-beta-D-mannosaminyltransferase
MKLLQQPGMNEKLKILSLSVDHTSFTEALQNVLQWGISRTPSYVCFANVHMVIEAYKDPAFLQQLNNATLVVADGKPVAAACKWLHGKNQERIAGMDFMPRLLEAAAIKGLNIFLYGSTQQTLEVLKATINKTYPGCHIAGAISPPFRPLTTAELETHIKTINDAGAHIVMVSLGCPKQEKWMASNYKAINAVLLGLGGAFAVTAGQQKRSPVWMQKTGLEWLHRLLQDPRRLFKRYLVTNSLFAWLLSRELIKRKSL